MKRILLGSAIALLATPVFAGTMDSTFGNTTTVTNTKTNGVLTMHFEPDNTYTATGTSADGQPVEVSGTWKIEDDKICTQPNAPEGGEAPAETCADHIDGKNPGDTWEITDNNGDTLSVTITEGR